jgi:hypothetical protein
VTGLRSKPVSLRGKERIAGEGENGFVFSNLTEDVFELNLPILPVQSGVMQIEAWAENHRFTHRAEFTVSDFLEMKLVCRIETRVAQLSAFVTSPAVLKPTDVQFSGDENESIEAISIGLPLIVGRKASSALFILQRIPDSGIIFAQQEGLQPFSLHLNVEKMNDEAFAEKELDPTTTQTILVPIGCQI